MDEQLFSILRMIAFVMYDIIYDNKDDLELCRYKISMAFPNFDLTLISLTRDPFEITFIFALKRYKLILGDGEIEMIEYPTGGFLTLWNN